MQTGAVSEKTAEPVVAAVHPTPKAQEGNGVFSFLGKAGKAIGGVGVGVAKSVIKLPQQAASLGADIGLRAAAAVRPDATYEQLKEATKNSDIAKGVERPEWTKAQNSAEKVGETVGDIAQFFIPVGGAVKAAGSVGKAVEGVKAAGAVEKAVVGAEKVVEGVSEAQKALGFGKKLASEAFEQGARTAIQEGKADESAVVAAGIGAMMPVLGAGLGLAKNQLPAWSKKLEEVNLRLTPQQRRQFTDKIDDVTEYMSKNKIIGTAEKRLSKVTERYETMEPQLEKFLKETAADRMVPKEGLMNQLEVLKKGYQDRVDTELIEGQIDRIINTIKTKQPKDIKALSLNKLKRSAYDSAYNEAGNKVLDDVMHDVGDVFRKNIEDVTDGLQIAGKDIAGFNQEYSTLINARKLLRTAASRKDVGFLSKLVSTLVGGGLGTAAAGPFGTAVGAAVAAPAAEVLAGTLPRSALAAGLRTLGEKSPSKTINPFVQGVTSQILQGQD